MIELTGVTYWYPGGDRPSLVDVDWRVEPGSVCLVAGPSGCGKSTLLRCLNGLVPHFYGGRFGGRVRVGERDPIAVGPAEMSDLVGCVFQDPEAQAVLPVVADELAFGPEQHRLPAATIRRRVEEVLDLLGIAALRRREVATLSGGERQRLALAAVLALQPSVLVLDEPTSQLDPQSAEMVMATLARLNHDLGLTIILAEHRLERAMGLADRLLLWPGENAAPSEYALRAGIGQVAEPPPIIRLARRLGWESMPLTIREGRQLARGHQPAPLTSAAPITGPTRAPSEAARPHDRRGDPPALRVEGLRFSFGREQVLRDCSLRVERGELVALLGRNGAGKTTLLRLIMGLLQPERGRIEIGGRAVGRTGTAEIARLVGYVPQRPAALLFAETVRAEIEFTRRHHPQAIATDPLLERLGLSRLIDRYPRDLSVGEQQRVALAAILAANPPLLLFDEPTRGLDAAAKQRLATHWRELQAEGRGILLATHDVELVAQSADRVVILGDGQVIADGPPRLTLAGSLTYAPQINRLFGGQYLTVDDIITAEARPALPAPGDRSEGRP